MDIKISLAYDHRDEIAELFSEYTAMLVEKEPGFAKYLEKQHYTDELADLEWKYGFPNGRLYIAHCGDDPVGCIGLMKFDDESCELKRLYVREKFRGQHLGRTLTQRIIADAREIGYKHILLDTFPFLESAIKLYKAAGFYEIDSYNNRPMDNMIYLKYDL